MSVTMVDPEVKVIRKVRTPAGARKYKQPIGSIIVADGKPPLANLRILRNNENDGYDTVAGPDGKHYDVGYDDTNGVWVATTAGSWDDFVVDDAATEEEAYQLLNDHLGNQGGKHRKGSTALGSMSKYDTEKQRQSGRKKMVRSRDDAKKKYGDKRSKDYDKFIAAHIVNFDKAVKEDNWSEAQHWLDQIFDAIRGKEFQKRIDSRQDQELEKRRKFEKAYEEGALKRRADKISAELEKSKAFHEGKKRMEEADRKRRESLQRRVDGLKKYTEPGPDYDRDIADNISRYHEEMAHLAEMDTSQERMAVIERAKIHLDAAERRATAKQNAGYVQHRPAGTGAGQPPAPPRPGDVGSRVNIGGIHVEVTEKATKGPDGTVQMAFEYDDREYEVEMPSYQDDKPSRLVVRDKATGKTEEGYIPPRDEAGPDPAVRSRHANSRLAEVVKRLAKKLQKFGASDRQRKETLDKGSRMLTHQTDKPLTPHDDQKFSTLRRHLDNALDLNDDERAQAILDLMDDMFNEYGVKPHDGVRQQIRQMRDAVRLIQKQPTLSMEKTNTLDTLKRVEPDRLARYIAACRQELSRIGNPTKKNEKMLVNLITANIERAQAVLNEHR